MPNDDVDLASQIDRDSGRIRQADRTSRDCSVRFDVSGAAALGRFRIVRDVLVAPSAGRRVIKHRGNGPGARVLYGQLGPRL